MKKFYTLLAASLFAVAANAATINFMQNGAVLPNNDEVSFDKGAVDPYGGITYNPEIFILSDQSVTVNVKAISLTGQQIQMCCGGDCESGENVTKNDVKLVGGTPLETQFEYIYIPKEGVEKPSIVSALLAVELPEDPGEYVAQLTVMFDLKSNSVSVLEADTDVVYRNGSLEYNVDKAYEFAIYDTNGRMVYSAVVNGKGSIDTTSLADGGYIYRIGNKAGKFLKN